jgi:ubiquinone/menaquinone biosynthesis C-methylase UbiE
MTTESSNRATDNVGRYQEEIITYWNGRSSEYDSRPHHGLRSHREKEVWLETLLSLLPPTPSDILDVGTGTGFLALLLAELGHRVVGIDLAPDMLEIAQSKCTGEISPRFEMGDAAAPSFPDGSFDVITSRHLLWTLLDPVRAFCNWHRLLRPGGRVIAIDSLNPSPRQPQLTTYSEEVIKALPLRHTGKPDPALELFRAAAFADVRAERLKNIEEIQQEIDPESAPPDRHVFIALRGASPPA